MGVKELRCEVKKGFVAWCRFGSLKITLNYCNKEGRTDVHLELVHTDPAIYSNFQHIQDSSVIHPNKSQTLWSLFGRLANDKQ